MKYSALVEASPNFSATGEKKKQVERRKKKDEKDDFAMIGSLREVRSLGVTEPECRCVSFNVCRVLRKGWRACATERERERKEKKWYRRDTDNVSSYRASIDFASMKAAHDGM